MLAVVTMLSEIRRFYARTSQNLEEYSVAIFQLVEETRTTGD